MDYLNLGCGRRFHPDWTNVNFTKTGENVIVHNLLQKLPFSDNSFDAIYHSHVLEHFPKEKAHFFMEECCRVLRPQGILRVVVPDLEQIVRTYLIALEKAQEGSQEWSNNYDWMLLEIYDQAVRTYPGGAMATYLSQEKIPNLEFVLQRCGIEIQEIIETQLKQQNTLSSKHSNGSWKKILKSIYRFLRYSHYRREILLQGILKEEYSTLQLGRFRQNGSIHQWMYDSYSLNQLLTTTGFQQVTQWSAMESYLPDWQSFHLDTEPDGAVYKPESLYMEGIKRVEEGVNKPSV